MTFWEKINNQDASLGDSVIKSVQLPSSQVNEVFGEVNVAKFPESTEVLFTILMEPTGGASEGWQTGVALDASLSMEEAYGMKMLAGPFGPAPRDLINEYLAKGWITTEIRSGKTNYVISKDAKRDMVLRGHGVLSANEMQPIAQEMTAYLAKNLDADGGTTVIYWACGEGDEIEEMGDLTAESCRNAIFEGPRAKVFGYNTFLLPAVKFFEEKFRDSDNGMYIFVTDGKLVDLPQVKDFTIQLCKQIESGQRNPMKCVLIGVGSEVDESQMEELDDLDSGTEVDIWDHKIASEMRQLVEIFAEVVSENHYVAPMGRISDEHGTVVADFTDGLPAKVSFSMAPTSNYFELEVSGQIIRQSVNVGVQD